MKNCEELCPATAGLAHTPPVIISAAGRAGLPRNETSLASIASRAGYRTAAIGKVGGTVVQEK